MLSFQTDEKPNLRLVRLSIEPIKSGSFCRIPSRRSFLRRGGGEKVRERISVPWLKVCFASKDKLRMFCKPKQAALQHSLLPHPSLPIF